MKAENFSSVKKILLIILFANIVVALLKVVIGYIIKSSSMTADGFHSITDGSSNVVGLIGIYLASKPIDEDHPYGHKKYETLAGLFIAGMLFFIAVKIIVEAFSRFFNPVAPEISFESLIVLLATLAVNIFVSNYEYKQGKKLNSHILVSDSMHTRSDIYVTIGVLLTLIGIKLGLPIIIDPLASLVVSGFILHAAYEILKEGSDILVDRVAIDTEKVKEIALSFCDVKTVHKIRSRGMADDIHLDLHIMTNPDMSVEQSHNLTHELEKKINDEFNKPIQLIVHIEPYYEQSPTDAL